MTNPAAELRAANRRSFLTRVGPHRRAGEVVIRHDLGDAIARQHGMAMVRVLCGRGDPNGVTTTITTTSDERTRCPNCRDVIESRAHLVTDPLLLQIGRITGLDGWSLAALGTPPPSGHIEDGSIQHGYLGEILEAAEVTE